MTDAGALQRW